VSYVSLPQSRAFIIRPNFPTSLGLRGGWEPPPAGRSFCYAAKVSGLSQGGSGGRSLPEGGAFILWPYHPPKFFYQAQARNASGMIGGLEGCEGRSG